MNDMLKKYIALYDFFLAKIVINYKFRNVFLRSII